MKCIHAHTDVKYENYPAFVSVNQRDDGTYCLIVRSAEGTCTSSIDLDRRQLADIAVEILNHFNEEPQ